MTVAELISKLLGVNPDRVVVMSKDGEGNSYSPLYKTETATYVADTTWEGEIGLEELTDDLRKMGFAEEDVKENGVPALVLWPTN